MTLNVVLTRTEYSSNVGATARAAANMGVQRLILVDPRCPLDNAAHQMAAGAQELLHSVTIYKDWSEFYARENDGVRIALTRRGGRRRKVVPLQEKINEMVQAAVTPESEPLRNLYLIFGPEADGLDSDDLALVNWTCHLPVYGDFASYNLAQAVLLSLFIARQGFPPQEMPEQVTGREDEPQQPFYFPDDLVKRWLEAMGFDVQARRSSAYLTLRRLFLQNQPTRHEIQVLEAILQQNIRKLSVVLRPLE